MSEKRWKAQERRIARRLGLRRNPASGGDQPDLEGEWLVVEVKDRSRFPTWIEIAVIKALERAGPDRLGIAVLTGPSASRDLVVLDLRDFIDYWGTDRGVRPRR